MTDFWFAEHYGVGERLTDMEQGVYKLDLISSVKFTWNKKFPKKLKLKHLLQLLASKRCIY